MTQVRIALLSLVMGGVAIAPLHLAAAAEANAENASYSLLPAHCAPSTMSTNTDSNPRLFDCSVWVVSSSGQLSYCHIVRGKGDSDPALDRGEAFPSDYAVQCISHTIKP